MVAALAVFCDPSEEEQQQLAVRSWGTFAEGWPTRPERGCHPVRMAKFLRARRSATTVSSGVHRCPGELVAFSREVLGLPPEAQAPRVLGHCFARANSGEQLGSQVLLEEVPAMSATVRPSRRSVCTRTLLRLAPVAFSIQDAHGPQRDACAWIAERRCVVWAKLVLACRSDPRELLADHILPIWQRSAVWRTWTWS